MCHSMAMLFGAMESSSSICLDIFSLVSMLLYHEVVAC